jgi:hypothetical protein
MNERVRLEGEVHARPSRVDTSGAESLGWLFLFLICLVAVLTSVSRGPRGNTPPQAPAAAPHAAALSAP